MSINRRPALYPALTGAAGGLAAWSAVEAVLIFSGAFPDYRILLLGLGAASGFMLGAIAPTATALRQGQKERILSSILIGAFLGLVAGALGMILGQWILSSLMDRILISTNNPFMGALARIPGWTILGLAIGTAGGIRTRSFRRFLPGLLGGFLGGLLGGLFAEFLTLVLPQWIGRALGMTGWGLSVAVIADAAERRRAKGQLLVLNGPLKGRSFPMIQKTFVISPKTRADLTIPGDAESQDLDHGATVLVGRGGVTVAGGGSGDLEVNGDVVNEANLRYGDVVKVGKTTFVYEVKS